MATPRQELGALKRMIEEVDLILETSPALPQNRTGRSRELLRSAIALTDDLLKQEKLPAAKLLGKKGGSQTAKRGSEYFRQIAAQRKTNGGGRPRKIVE